MRDVHPDGNRPVGRGRPQGKSKNVDCGRAKIGQARYCRAVARHCARHAALQCLLQLHRVVRLEPHDRLDSGGDGGGKAASRAAPADDAGKDRAAGRLSRADAANGIPGQIFSVRNNEIFLFNQTRLIRSFHRSGGWTPEKLADRLKGTFGPSLTPLDRSADVFAWDPI